MKKSNLLLNLLVISLGFLFSISLFYLTLEFHNILNFFLEPIFPGLSHIGISYEFRIIGLICFCIIVMIIILGFIIKKLKVSSIGTFILFLPTFGHFFVAMFLLIGIQVIQLILLPFREFSFNLLSLGSLIKLPYIFIDFFASFSINKDLTIHNFIYGIILIGLIIFSFSVITWLQGVLKKKEITDSSIYKYSRHPQYLGYLFWSYGIYLLTLIPLKYYPRGYKYFDYTFIWFLLALIIIGIALYEEILMKDKFPEKYPEYQKKASFLIPIPKIFKSLLTLPMRLVFKRDLPENRKEILFLLFFYGSLIILISFLLDPFLIVN